MVKRIYSNGKTEKKTQEGETTHRIPAGRELTKEEQEYTVAVLIAWIEKKMNKDED